VLDGCCATRCTAAGDYLLLETKAAKAIGHGLTMSSSDRRKVCEFQECVVTELEVVPHLGTHATVQYSLQPKRLNRNTPVGVAVA